MAYLNIGGFESGDNQESSATSGTFSIQGTTVRTGTYALQVNPTTTGAGYYVFRLISAAGVHGSSYNIATVWYRFYFRYATKPTSSDEPIVTVLDTVPTQKFEVRLNSSGNLAAYNTVNTLLATGTTVLAQDTWYQIALKVGTGATGAYEVLVDGISEVSGTGNLTTANNGQIRLGKTANRNGNTVDFYYDDFAASDTAYPGDGKCLRLGPIGAGTYTAWTGTYADVDENPADGDTTFISTSTSGNAETATLQSTGTVGITGTVNAVTSFAIVKDEGGTSAFNVRLRSGATDDDTTNRDVTNAAYSALMKIYATDPNTAAAWTLAAIDLLEVGVEANAAVAHRCTAVMAMVDFTPAAPAGVTDHNLTLLGVGA